MIETKDINQENVVNSSSKYIKIHTCGASKKYYKITGRTLKKYGWSIILKIGNITYFY